MKKKFAWLSVLLLSFLLLSSSSCKKAEGVYVIIRGDGSVYYDGIAFTTDLFFRCAISNPSEITGMITAWKFVFKFGNTELLEINSENCASLNIVQYEDLRIHPNTEREIVGKTVPPLAGDRFPLSDPDNMDISVTITDDNSNQQTIHFNAAVAYEEYND